MAFNSLSNDVSLQQFPELWESSRFAQRQDSLEKNHTESFHERQTAKNSQESLQIRERVMQNQHTGAIGEGSKGKEPMRNSDEDAHDMLASEQESIKHGTPTWLSSALLRQQAQSSCDDTEGDPRDATDKWCPVCAASGSQCMCAMPMHAADASTSSFPNQNYAHWLSMQGAMHAPQHRDELGENSKDFTFRRAHHSSRMATELNLSPAGQARGQQFLEVRHSDSGPRHGEYERAHQTDWESARQKEEWENARNKAMIVAHPLYPDLLAAHAECLRVGTPVDQLPHIEAQLGKAQEVTDKYGVLHPDQLDIQPEEKVELDQFMAQYILLLTAFKDQLQEHVYGDVTDAMMSCWELEQALYSLTGVSPGEGTGATMSDDDEEYDSDYCAYDPGLDPQDSGGFGPLVPTETERTLMERVRQELKCELKQGYRARIVDVREEILRKRRAGKLPEGTTTILKAWWHAHSKWPYPTEDEKERLIQETGLELKQVNNWFINQRKRNWHSNPLSSSSDMKNKRKSW